MNSSNNNSSQSIAQIAIEFDLKLIKQRALMFGKLLKIVVDNYRNGDIKSVHRDLPALDKFLDEIIERTGRNYCHFIGQSSPDRERDYTSSIILKSKLFVRALGFPNGIPQDVSDLDALKLIQTIIAEKTQRVKIEDERPQPEDKNWTTGVFMILTGFNMKIVDSFVNDPNLTNHQVKIIIEKSRLFTEDNRYYFANACCSRYIAALMPFAKSLELAFYTLGNEKKKQRTAKNTHPDLCSTISKVIDSRRLKPVPIEISGNNSSDIDRADRTKMSDRNDSDDYINSHPCEEHY
jgi:hypothetical protein